MTRLTLTIAILLAAGCDENVGLESATEAEAYVNECVVTKTMPPEHVVKFCFASPWRIGNTCSEPDAGQCMEIIQLPKCEFTTCDYLACQEALDKHPCEVPPECAEIQACADAED